MVEQALQHHEAVDECEYHCRQSHGAHGPCRDDVGEWHCPCRRGVCHERLGHVGQHDIEVHGGEECGGYAQHCHLVWVRSNAFHYGALHGQCVAEQCHDSEYRCLAHGEVHGEHDGKAGIGRDACRGDEANGGGAGQPEVLEHGVEVHREPRYDAVVLQKRDDKRDGQHDLQQPQCGAQCRTYSGNEGV